MNNAPEPSENPQTGQPGVNSPQLDPGNPRWALLKEILTLMVSGADPRRLQQLLRQNDVEQARRIDELLGLDPAKMMRKAAEQCAEYLDSTEPLRRELTRPDLTIPEARRLAKFGRQLDRLITSSLLLQRGLLERKLRPGSRRGRLTS